MSGSQRSISNFQWSIFNLVTRTRSEIENRELAIEWFVAAWCGGVSCFLVVAALGEDLIGFFGAHRFIELFIAHHHRRGSAAGQALHVLQGEFPVGRGLQTVPMGRQPQFSAEMPV